MMWDLLQCCQIILPYHSLYDKKWRRKTGIKRDYPFLGFCQYLLMFCRISGVKINGVKQLDCEDIVPLQN